MYEKIENCRKRLDVSDEFWKQFEMYDKSNKKVMGLYEIGSIDNQNICTIAINPKEYFEKFKNRKINKKGKGVRRDTEGMSFKAYANRITSLRQLDCKSDKKKITQKRFQVKNTNMMRTTVKKVQIASLNDKRYYFSDGIISLPFGHPSLSELRDYKKLLLKMHTNTKEEKDKLLQLENRIVNNNKRLRILHSIFSQPITYYILKSNKRSTIKRFDYLITRDYILNSMWL